MVKKKDVTPRGVATGGGGGGPVPPQIPGAPTPQKYLVLCMF